MTASWHLYTLANETGRQCTGYEETEEIMHPIPDEHGTAFWFFSLYGATMMSVQGLEWAVSGLYVVVNVDPSKSSGAGMKRRVKNSIDRMWCGFQQGSAGMKLNDRKVGIKGHITEDLYNELDAFLKGPRNQLAHNFLLERIALMEQGGKDALIRAGAELLPLSLQAGRLTDRLRDRTLEIIDSWPAREDPPEEMLDWFEQVARMASLKQFPEPVIEKTKAAGRAENSGA